jgi:hypothetical protein
MPMVSIVLCFRAAGASQCLARHDRQCFVHSPISSEQILPNMA